MRPNQNNNKRLRGRSNGGSNNNRRGPNPLTRSYESNGPDVKVRGTAAHVTEKYVQLARDAHVAGDTVAAENYLQHAEHYYRIIATAQAAQLLQQQIAAGTASQSEADEIDDDDFDGGLSDRFTFRAPQSQQGAEFSVANGVSEPREQPRDTRDMREPTENRDPRGPREPRELREPREAREPRDTRDTREPREPRDNRDTRDNREPRDGQQRFDNRNQNRDRNSEFRRPERPNYQDRAAAPERGTQDRAAAIGDQPSYQPDLVNDADGATPMGAPNGASPEDAGDRRPRNDRFGQRRDRFRDRRDTREFAPRDAAETGDRSGQSAGDGPSDSAAIGLPSFITQPTRVIAEPVEVMAPPAALADAEVAAPVRKPRAPRRKARDTDAEPTPAE